MTDIKKSHDYYLKVVKRYQDFLQPNEKFQLVKAQHIEIMSKVENALGAKKAFEDLESSIRNGDTIQMQPCGFLTIPQDSISMLSGRLFINQSELPDGSMELLPLRKRSDISSASQYTDIYNF